MIEAGLNSPWDVPGIQVVKSLGAVRARVGWEDDWGQAELVQLVKDLHSAGLKIMLCCTPGDRSYGSTKFVNFCAWCAGLLDPGLDILEVHNEPNHQPFANQPDAAAYAQEFVQCMIAVRNKNKSLPVITGGLSPESGPRDLPAFLQGMMTANARVAEANGFGVHTYEFPYDPRTFANSWNPVGKLDVLSNMWKYIGRPNMPFHITEFGAPSALNNPDGSVRANGSADPNYPNAPYRYSPAFQAEWLTRYLEAFRMSQANIVTAQLFTLNDGLTTGTGWEPHTGVRDSKNVLKPIAQTFRTWAATAGKR